MADYKVVIGEPLTKKPENCRHGHLEPISAYLDHVPVEGPMIPSFVCTKCGAVLFLNKTQTGSIFTLQQLPEGV